MKLRWHATSDRTEPLRRLLGQAVEVVPAQAHEWLELVDSGAEGDAPIGPPVVAIGWATVDAQRAGDALSLDPLSTESLAPSAALGPASGDQILGAHTWTVQWRGTTMVLLEPATEGRVAAALARYGEGLAALYVEDRTDPHDQDLRRQQLPALPTALGRSGRLHMPCKPWGPFLILLRPEADSAA